jgi:hypothetical protein
MNNINGIETTTTVKIQNGHPSGTPGRTQTLTASAVSAADPNATAATYAIKRLKHAAPRR